MLELEAVGRAGVDEVWDRYVRPSRWPQWAPQVRSVSCRSDPLVAGARGVVRGPLVALIPFRIESVDPSTRTWTWRVGLGRMNVKLEHGVEPGRHDRADHTSRAWVRIHLPTPLALPYVPLAKIALRRLVEA